MADTDALYKRAEEAFKKGNWDYARDLFLQILLLDPDHAASRTALRATIMKKFQTMGATGKIKLMAIRGQFEIQLKSTKDAPKRIDLCQKFLNDDPTNAKIRTILAGILLEQGKFNGAATEAWMAFKDDNTLGVAAKLMVEAYRNLGKVKEAQEALEVAVRLIKDDRDLERLQRDLAAMSTMKAGFDQAGSFRDVMKDKGSAEELEKRSHLIQTDADFDRVLAGYLAEIATSPNDPKFPRKVAEMYLDKKKDYKTAQDWFRKASALAPADSLFRDKIDDCEMKLIEVRRDAAKKAADPKLKELQIELLKFQIQTYERRVEEHPTDMGLRFNLGKAYFLGGMIDKAVSEFQQSVKDPKKKNDSHFYLGLGFQKKRMYDMAEKQYIAAEENVLSQDLRCNILYHRAVCHFEAGRKEKAVELGNTIVEIDINYKDIATLVTQWQGA